MSFRRPIVGGLFTVALVYAKISWAGDPAAAQVLFDDARKSMAKGDWATACPKLEESQRLDPGIGTEYQLASCHEHIGRTATAWAEYLDVAAVARAAGQTAREKAAREKAAALEPSLARLTVTVPKDTTGLVVLRDGGEIGRAQWGTPLPIDPGPHTFVARAPGKRTWETTVRVAQGDRTASLAIPILDPEPKTTAAAPPAPAGTTTTTSAETTLPSSIQDEGTGRGNGQRIAGGVVFAAGLAGIGVGTAFGLLSKSHRDDANANCDASNHCNADGLKQRDDAFRDGTISTVGFIAGGAAVLTGAILYLSAPTDSSRSRGSVQAAPTVGAGTMGVAVTGRF